MTYHMTYMLFSSVAILGNILQVLQNVRYELK